MADPKFGYTLFETEDGTTSVLASTLEVPNGSLEMIDAGSAKLNFGPNGDVVGPDSSIDGHVAVFSGDTGKAVRVATPVTIEEVIDSIGGTVSGTLAAIPNPADTPASADALRDDLVANVLPTIRNAFSTLNSQANIIIGMARSLGLVAIPPEEYPGLLRGWSARYITGLADAAAIATVPDRSVANDPAVQATGTNQPIYKTAQQNGLPTIRLDGSNDFLGFTEVTTIRTVYLVMKHDTGSQDFAGFLGSPATYFDFHGGEGNKLISSANANSNLRNGSAWINGFAENPVNVLKSTSVRVFAFRSIGNLRASLIASDRGTTGRFWDGDMYDVWLYSTAHTDAQIVELSHYFTSVYNLTETSVLAPLLVLDGNSLMNTSLQVRITNCLAGNCAAGTPLESQWVVQNFGVSGQTTPQMLADFSTQVAPLYNANRSKNIYVMWEATNHHYVNPSVTASQAFDSILTLCQTAQAVGFDVVIPNVLPRSNSGTPSDFETWRSSFNSLLASNEATYGYKLADVAGNTTIGDAGDETNTTYYSDLVHLTDAGNNIVAPIIATEIQAF